MSNVGDLSPSAAGFQGYQTLDVASPAGQAQPAPQPPVQPAAPPVPQQTTGVPGVPPLHLAIHRVEGALCAPMVSPLVRMHVVDAATGYRWGKSAGQQCIFNVDKEGQAFLRRAKTTPGKDPRSQSPWVADSGQSSFFRPFTTLPAALRFRRGQLQQESPCWEESFFLLLDDTALQRAALLFEILDATVKEDLGAEPRVVLSPIAWAFAHISPARRLSQAWKERPRRIRMQLFKYRRRGLCGKTQLEENDVDDFPVVVQEYLAAGVGEEKPGVLAAAFASFLGRGRQNCQAALEITLSLAQQPIQTEKLAQQLAQPLPEGQRVDAPPAPSSPSVAGAAATLEGQASPKAESMVEEILGHLAPEHARKPEQACLLPSTQLWQLPSGRRGASRMALSPAGSLLAVALSRSKSSSELRIYAVASGRLYATCAEMHEALVYDLCWHSFEKRQEGISVPPLLISCGGDGRVLIHEVPEDLAPQPGLWAQRLKLHARVSLPADVYSARPYSTLSSDPRCLVLVAGYRGGLSLCQVTRDLKIADSGFGSTWAPHPPQTVQVPFQAVRQSQAPGQTDILCVRFSTQANSLDSLYASDDSGHLLLFQMRNDASAGLSASLVRSYASSEIMGSAIYSFEIVTKQLLQGRRITSVQASMSDDWALLFCRDHTIRLTSLQRGVLKVEQKMLGLECSSYPVRGSLSPDGKYVACGSETGELLFWTSKDGKPVVPPAVPQVRLAGPLMDTIWSDKHHLMACCALDANALPLLAFVGEAKEKPREMQEEAMLHRAVPLQAPAPEVRQQVEESALAISGISTALDSDYTRWADGWINSNENPRSAIALEEKRRMKENILLNILDKKGVEEAQSHLETARTLPGSM